MIDDVGEVTGYKLSFYVLLSAFTDINIVWQEKMQALKEINDEIAGAMRNTTGNYTSANKWRRKVAH